MRRLAPLLLLVPVLAACGSTREQRFVSRPDLRPPALVVTTREPAAAPGYVFLAPKRHAQQKGPLIVDRGGGIVWFHPLEAEATDFRVQRYRGRPVLTWWQGHSARGFGSGEYVIADETYRRVATVRAGNGLAGDEHEFQLTPRGTALITIYHREGRVLDSIVQEVEVASGRVLLEWRSIDHVPPAESYVPLSAGGGSSPLAKGDYFHVNSVEVEPDGNLLVSARNTSALYEIDRRTGEVLWRLGGKRSDFRMGPGTRFAWQHDARRQPDGTITLFDDEAAPPLGKRSRAIRLRLDTTAMTATLVRADVHPAGLLTSSQGNAQVLRGGHVLVGWGAAGYVTEFDGDGRVVFDAHLPAEVDTYRAYRFRWTGRPSTRPAIAVRRKDLDEAYVYASWNGATKVARWLVLAGDDAAHLHRVAGAARDGFETRVTVARGPRFFAVRAFDRAGRALGTSAAVSLRRL